MKIQIEKTTKKSKSKKKPAEIPAYKREDIESILTNIMFVSVSLAAVLLTLAMLISVIKH
jgi:hypothetical protein